MAVQLFENGSSSTLLNPIGASDTQLQVQAGEGTKFPIISSTDQFWVGALEDVSGNVEIVTVTGGSGDTFTVVRGKEGTSAIPFAAGSRFELRVTAETLRNFSQKSGDIFEGVLAVPGIDLLPFNPLLTWNPFEYRFDEEAAVPTHRTSGPIDLAVQWFVDIFKTSSTRWEFGMDTLGRFITPGSVRWKWYAAQDTDPDLLIDAVTEKPEADHIKLCFRPNAIAPKVSYCFVTKSDAGTEHEITFNPDGSINAVGEFTLSSLILPYQEDPQAEEIKLGYRQNSLAFSPNERTITFDINNLDGNIGTPASPEPGTAIQYFLPTRQADGTIGGVSIYPDGAVSITGQFVATKVLVSSQGAPSTLAPNELITKAYYEANPAGGAVAGGYFSELLYDGSLSTGTAALLHPLITVGPPEVVHFQQVMVECFFPNANPGQGHASYTLDTQTLRVGTPYTMGQGGGGDNSGAIQFQFNDYLGITFVAAQNGAVVTRVTGISFAGNPFP